MFLIPGIVISVITFPGVIVHELAHRFFCRLCRVPVFEVCYFRFENPCGYVIHERSNNPWKNFLISIGPFIFNTIIGLIIIFPAAIEVIEFKNFTNILSLILIWLGVSILMHAFPSTGDASNLYETVIKNKKVMLPVKIIVMPIIGIIYIGAIGSVFWLDFFYAIGIGMLIPNLIVNFF